MEEIPVKIVMLCSHVSCVSSHFAILVEIKTPREIVGSANTESVVTNVAAKIPAAFVVMSSAGRVLNQKISVTTAIGFLVTRAEGSSLVHTVGPPFVMNVEPRTKPLVSTAVEICVQRATRVRISLDFGNVNGAANSIVESVEVPIVVIHAIIGSVPNALRNARFLVW